LGSADPRARCKPTHHVSSDLRRGYATSQGTPDLVACQVLAKSRTPVELASSHGRIIIIIIIIIIISKLKKKYYYHRRKTIYFFLND
jgi:hypothetical protein